MTTPRTAPEPEAITDPHGDVIGYIEEYEDDLGSLMWRALDWNGTVVLSDHCETRAEANDMVYSYAERHFYV
ncbi:hypothetical protein ACFY05_31875 [Microtetraspora fusca]|uniref:Uncharacterized protein n=1 Tax=Microtetraspora fusca TaxID=1997 RepID=A0ABW6VDP6_MICFU